MKELMAKLSSYNLLNYLIPGVLFAVISEKLTAYSFHHDDLIISAFIYYFIGMVISRVGSLVIEPLLRKISFLKFADYSEFVVAAKKDSKIEILSEANNMCRTLNAMFILLLLTKAYEVMANKYEAINTWSPYTLIGLLLILFLWAHRKQTSYITKRVKANKS